MQENKTLSLVLPENWHFLRGDMKGLGFKCKLSNCVAEWRGRELLFDEVMVEFDEGFFYVALY